MIFYMIYLAIADELPVMSKNNISPVENITLYNRQLKGYFIQYFTCLFRK